MVGVQAQEQGSSKRGAVQHRRSCSAVVTGDLNGSWSLLCLGEQSCAQISWLLSCRLQSGRFLAQSCFLCFCGEGVGFKYIHQKERRGHRAGHEGINTERCCVKLCVFSALLFFCPFFMLCLLIKFFLIMYCPQSVFDHSSDQQYQSVVSC